MSPRKLIVAVVFLIGFPALFMALLAVYEAQASRLTEHLFGTRLPTPTANFLTGRGGMPVVGAALVVVMVGLGVVDIAFLFLKSSVTPGARYNAILPSGHPVGYALLRLRRYMLVPVLLAVVCFGVYYVLRIRLPSTTPHYVVLPLALLVARRPLDWSLGTWWGVVLQAFNDFRMRR